MLRRTLFAVLSLVFVVLAPMSGASAAQTDDELYSVYFTCYRDGSARLITTNTWSGTPLRFIVHSKSEVSTFVVEDTVYINPGESNVRDIYPVSPAYYGWMIVVERLSSGADVWIGVEGGVYEYPRECFPYGAREESGPAPTASKTPEPNSFNLLSADRMCADQSFRATWSGANIASLRFSLSNTSDDWTTGWFDVDAAAGSVSKLVDHHSYDKVLASVVYVDGTEELVSVNVGSCTESQAPPPPVTGGESPVTVKSLPSTGAGNETGMVLLIGSITTLACAVILVGSLRKRS